MASIIKRASGWQVQIRKLGYQTVSKRFERKSDADIWARITESEMDRGVYIDRSEAEKTTLADILKRYLAENSVRKLGFKPEQSRINGLLNHSISTRFLASLKSSDFAAYRESRLAVVCGTTVNKELNLSEKFKLQIEPLYRDLLTN